MSDNVVYSVVYLKHSIFKDVERVEVELTQPEIAALLTNGMVSLVEVKQLFENGLLKKR